MRAVVDTCARELLTSHGLRSLSAADPDLPRSLHGRLMATRCRPITKAPCGAGCWDRLPRAHYRVYGDARWRSPSSLPSRSI